MNKLIVSSVRCPDGTVLISRHRHDFVCHNDTVTNKKYCLDGGNDYFRFVGDLTDCEDLCIYSDTPHEELRKKVTWGVARQGFNEYIKASVLSRAHIENIIKDGYSGGIVDVLKAELLWRDEHESKSEAKRLEIQREAAY